METHSNDKKSGDRLPATPRLLWFILAAALVLSFGYAATFRPAAPEYLVSDSAEYHSLAVSILTEHSFQKSVFRAPGYPAFLAVVYLFAGTASLWPVYFAQSLVLALTLFLVYKIALRITRDERTSVLAVALCAIWPPIWLGAGDVLTETLSGALVAGSLWLLLKAMDRPGALLCVGLGLVMGAMALTKGSFLLFIAAALLFVIFSGKDRLRRVGSALIVFCAAAALIVPWIVRDYKLTGAFVPIQTGGGMNLWLGNWPDYWRTQHEWGTYPKPVARLIRGKPEVERERILAGLGWNYIRQNPLRASGIFLRKFSFLWLGALGADPRGAGNPIPHIGSFGITKRSIAYVPLFVAALLGWLWLAPEARKRAWPMMALLVLWSVPYVLTMAVARYTVPVVYYEMLLAAVAVRRIGAQRRCLPTDSKLYRPSG